VGRRLKSDGLGNSNWRFPPIQRWAVKLETLRDFRRARPNCSALLGRRKHHEPTDGLDGIRWKRGGNLRAPHGASHLRPLGRGPSSLGDAPAGRASPRRGLWHRRRRTAGGSTRGPERDSRGLRPKSRHANGGSHPPAPTGRTDRVARRTRKCDTSTRCNV
jgi:hypothetical protein